MTDHRKHVLFVCIGNACRSQMAEAFARSYGSDVLIPGSAGLSPAMAVPRDTHRAMEEKNIALRDQFPKGLNQLAQAQFDLVINMSGFDLPRSVTAPVREWDVDDPVACDYDRHCEIRDQIETRVMQLILELRRAANRPEINVNKG